MPSILTQLVYLKYRAGAVVVPLAPFVKYRISGDVRTSHRVRVGATTTHRARVNANTTHRIQGDIS